jgi:hypothetical protein
MLTRGFFLVEFALFKTYGIYTIAKLLCETDQLVGPCCDKRAEDTSVIFQELIGQPLDSERCRIAIARMSEWNLGICLCYFN